MWIKLRLLHFRILHRLEKLNLQSTDLIAFILICTGILAEFTGPFLYIKGITEYYHKMAPDLVAIGLTVLIIDRANRAIAIRQEKLRLILQMGSPYHGFAIEAARQLRYKGWLHDGSVTWAGLSEADLSEVELTQAVLSGVQLRNANLSKAHLSGVKLDRADLKFANLREAYLGMADLCRADLAGADLTRASLGKAILEDANLSEANLSEANLSGIWHLLDRRFVYNNDDVVNLSRTNLSRVNLSKAFIMGVDLSSANLSNANLSEAKFDCHTKWPDGFDPVAAGAILVE